VSRFLTTEFIQSNIFIFIDDAENCDGKVSWRASQETLGGECQRSGSGDTTNVHFQAICLTAPQDTTLNV
jgi:hypothetical protein